MRKIILAAAVLLTGCLSTEMKQYVGQDISEVLLAYGEPAGVVDLPDGRRAYQYRRGGGVAIVPGAAHANTQVVGPSISTTTTASPSYVLENEGCLLTYIASPSGGRWTVTEVRVPKDLVC